MRLVIFDPETFQSGVPEVGVGWKLFALLIVVLTGWSFADSEPYTSTGLIHLMMSALSAAGLALMAFEIDFLPRKFWRAFSVAYAVYSVGLMAFSSQNLYKQYAVDGRSLSAVVSAFLIMATLQIAINIGLWVNASSRFSPRGNACSVRR
ncbi:hypothetical protein [Bradyrhizobium sp. BWC-3-1]|uniref:hypothetical protein n=1 Tax=Bradyrhizobium sp. BWC-3-1 TaxID=3080012 RepID=UPI00293EF570|nr:hypothetical protein [Bradyrhizobium sp. BWC-3-1]WOH60146.1 hypothetical protein RX329_08535 [Bradyrhizobium sp. BWC-3-1]